MGSNGQAEKERYLAIGEMMVIKPAEAKSQSFSEQNAGIVGGGNLEQNLP